MIDELVEPSEIVGFLTLLEDLRFHFKKHFSEKVLNHETSVRCEIQGDRAASRAPNKTYQKQLQTKKRCASQIKLAQRAKLVVFKVLVDYQFAYFTIFMRSHTHYINPRRGIRHIYLVAVFPISISHFILY